MLAAGGFESNREWLREAWGQNDAGEWPADNFLIRGTRFNQGVLIKDMMNAGADMIGDPSQSHCVAIDARAPLYDGGIVTRIDCVSLGIVVNKNTERFYDEGEDFWRLRDLGPPRGATAGANRLLDHRRQSHRPLHATGVSGTQADTLEALAGKLGLDAEKFTNTVRAFNAACQPGAFDHTTLDNCVTSGLTPANSLGTPHRHAALLRLRGAPWCDIHVSWPEDRRKRRRAFRRQTSSNLFVAGK